LTVCSLMSSLRGFALEHLHQHVVLTVRQRRQVEPDVHLSIGFRRRQQPDDVEQQLPADPQLAGDDHLEGARELLRRHARIHESPKAEPQRLAERQRLEIGTDEQCLRLAREAPDFHQQLEAFLLEPRARQDDQRRTRSAGSLDGVEQLLRRGCEVPQVPQRVRLASRAQALGKVAGYAARDDRLAHCVFCIRHGQLSPPRPNPWKRTVDIRGGGVP